MTDTEIINRLISIMNVGQHHKFLDEWHKIPGLPIESGKMWTKDAKRILHLMTSKKIVRHIRNQDNDAIVELRDNGLKIKETGGLKFDVSKLKDKFWTFGKKLFLWLTLGGLATWLLIWDRWIEPMINSKTNQQEEVIRPDSLTEQQTQDKKAIQDSSKANSIKTDSANSLKKESK